MKRQFSFGQVIGAVTIASAMLAGCGGGGGGDATTLSATTPASDPATSTPTTSTPTTSTPTTSTPTTPTSDPVVVPIATVDGIYNGTTSTNQAITALILADNHYYIMYSQPGVPASFGGVAFGLGTANGNSLSGDFKDINLNGGVSNGTLAGTYNDSKTTFGGALTYATNSLPTSFASIKDGSYATAPSLTTVAGVYTGTLAAGPLTAGSPVPSETLKLTITDQGVMSGDLTCSCTLQNATMSLNGSAYAVSLTFSAGDGTHPLHGQAFAGNAYFDAPNNRLVVAGTLLDAAQTPAIFVGTKP